MLEIGAIERLRVRALGAVARGSLATPQALSRAIVGPPRRNDRGDALDAQVHLICWLQERLQPPLTRSDIAGARRAMRRGMAVAGKPRPAGVSCQPLQLAARPCRLYRPAAGAGSLPLVVYYHGGGWVLGDLDSHDGVCGRIAAELPALVLSVDYRLAPEHVCPAAFEDAFAVYRALDAAALGADPGRVAVMGDSAGGNLAAAIAMACRDRGQRPPALQVLCYPGLDLRRRHASHRTCAEGPLLTAADIEFFIGKYGASDLRDPRVSPGADHPLDGLAPAIVTTSGFDPLRDECEDYAGRLGAAGVAVQHLHEPHLPHGYLSLDGLLPAADTAVARLMDAVRAALLPRS